LITVRRTIVAIALVALALVAPSSAPAATTTTGAVIGAPATKAGKLRVPVLVKHKPTVVVLKAGRIANPTSLRYGDRVSVRAGRATIRRTGSGPSFATLAARRGDVLQTSQRAVDQLTTAQQDLAGIAPGTQLTNDQFVQLQQLRTELNLLSEQLDALASTLQSAIDAANAAFGPEATLATAGRRARDRQVAPLAQLRDAARSARGPIDATVTKLDTAASVLPGTLPQLPLDTSPTLIINALHDLINTLFPPQP
jgi:hypothetical protein